MTNREQTFHVGGHLPHPYTDDARSFLHGDELADVAVTAEKPEDHVKHIQVTLRSGHVFDLPVSEGSLSAMLLEYDRTEEPARSGLYGHTVTRSVTTDEELTLKLFARLRHGPRPQLFTLTMPTEHECPAPPPAVVVPGLENGPALLYAKPGKDGAPPTLTDVLGEDRLSYRDQVVAGALALLAQDALANPTKPRKRKKVRA